MQNYWPVVHSSSRGIGGVFNTWRRCSTKITRFKQLDNVAHEERRVPLSRSERVFVQAWNLIVSKRQMYKARLKRVSETDERELTHYYTSEMMRLMNKVGKITDFDYMLSMKTLNQMELQPEGKLTVVFLSGIFFLLHKFVYKEPQYMKQDVAHLCLQ
jgi:hypothetical protein